MRDKVRAFLEANTAAGDRVVAAVSGGKDSMAMLHAVWSLSGALGLTVTAAHFHHGLRGAEADRDEAFVRDYCRENGIPLAVGRGHVPAYGKAHGMGTEEAARRLRYEFLATVDPGAMILTAHTADDNLETVLMHLIRGSGLHGLTGIPAVRDGILRPMLDVTRAQVEAYLAAHAVAHMEDSTNGDDGCLRNRIRHQVVPLLLRENPAATEAVSALCRTLRGEDAYMEAQSEAAFLSLYRDGALDREGLLALPEALRYRVLARFLGPVPELGRVHLEAALDLCMAGSPSGCLSLPGRFTLRRVYGRLRLEREAGECQTPAPVTVAPGQTVRFGPWQVSCRPWTEAEGPPDDGIVLDAGALEGPLTLRPRQPGDRISLPGGSRKLSRLMVDQKVPAHLRDTLPVVWSGDRIAAVLPLKAAAPFAWGRAGRDGILLSIKGTED